jgi:hypothetical protein
MTIPLPPMGLPANPDLLRGLARHSRRDAGDKLSPRLLQDGRLALRHWRARDCQGPQVAPVPRGGRHRGHGRAGDAEVDHYTNTLALLAWPSQHGSKGAKERMMVASFASPWRQRDVL